MRSRISCSPTRSSTPVHSGDGCFGTGSDVVVPYIYFSLRTGKGEKGTCTLIVTSDVGGSAGSPATFACDVKGIGIPDEFDYNPATQSAEPAKAVKG